MQCYVLSKNKKVAFFGTVDIMRTDAYVQGIFCVHYAVELLALSFGLPERADLLSIVVFIFNLARLWNKRMFYSVQRIRREYFSLRSLNRCL